MSKFFTAVLSYGAAGLLGLCFAQEMAQSPIQQHSGTQQAVRIIR